MDAELLMKIGSIAGKLEALEAQIKDLQNRFDLSASRYQDYSLQITKDLGEMRGELKGVQSGLHQLVAALRKGDQVTFNVQGGEATGSVNTQGGDFAGDNLTKGKRDGEAKEEGQQDVRKR